MDGLPFANDRHMEDLVPDPAPADHTWWLSLERHDDLPLLGTLVGEQSNIVKILQFLPW